MWHVYRQTHAPTHARHLVTFLSPFARSFFLVPAAGEYTSQKMWLSRGAHRVMVYKITKRAIKMEHVHLKPCKYTFENKIAHSKWIFVWFSPDFRFVFNRMKNLIFISISKAALRYLQYMINCHSCLLLVAVRRETIIDHRLLVPSFYHYKHGIL